MLLRPILNSHIINYYWPETNRLPERWVYLELAENYDLGSVAMARHMQVPMGHGKENAFIQRKGKLGELCIVNKESMTFHGLNSCQERRGTFLLPYGFWYSFRAWELPLSGLLVLFNWGFSLLNFYIFPFWSQSFSESITDQESGFLISATFCPLVSGKAFPG